MPSFVSASERIPGVYQEVNLQREIGLAQGTPKVLLIGERLTSASSAHDGLAKRMRTRADAVIYGRGSKIDLMVKAALQSAQQARLDAERGITPELYAMGVAPLIAPDVAEVQTVTFAGIATTAGTATLRVAQQTVTYPVAVGDTAATIAAALEAELARVEPDLPFTAGVAGAVITLTARERGAWGTELVVEYDTGVDAPAGITATIAETAAGTGNVSLTTSLDAALAQGPWRAVIVGEDSAAARTALRTHVRSSWDYTEAKYHNGICAVGTDFSDAETAAAAVDDWRVMVACAEKVAGSPIFNIPNSSRAFGFEVAASVGTRVYSQTRANFNFNLATLPISGRPINVQRSVVNDAIDGGVTAVLAHRNGADPGQIMDPVSSAVTDQTGAAPGAPDRTWAPFEIAKVVQTITLAMQAELAGFAQLTADEQTRLAAKAAALSILRDAARQGLIAAVADDQVTATFEIVGAATHLVLVLDYAVITGLDVIAVSHNVRRAAQ